MSDEEDPDLEFMKEPEPTTEQQWRDQLTRWAGRANVESLIMLGQAKRWVYDDA